jgi:hypothetical protein
MTTRKEDGHLIYSTVRSSGIEQTFYGCISHFTTRKEDGRLLNEKLQRERLAAMQNEMTAGRRGGVKNLQHQTVQSSRAVHGNMSPCNMKLHDMAFNAKRFQPFSEMAR